MADPMRHGDGMHYMRPDRVYRTSVLSPMYGYQPGADVQHVATMFTQGPDRAMMLQGLGAMPGPIQRGLARLQAWIAQRKAHKLMQVPASNTGIVPPQRLPPQAQGNAFGHDAMPGPAPAMAQSIAPHLATQMVGVLQLAQRYGNGYPGMASEALINRPLGSWYRY